MKRALVGGLVGALLGILLVGLGGAAHGFTEGMHGPPGLGSALMFGTLYIMAYGLPAAAVGCMFGAVYGFLPGHGERSPSIGESRPSTDDPNDPKLNVKN